MGTGYLYGNGGGSKLNFKVVGGVMPFGYINCRNFSAKMANITITDAEEKRITLSADDYMHRCVSYDFDVIPGQVLKFTTEVESGYTGDPRLGLRKWENGAVVATLVAHSTISNGKTEITYTVPDGIAKLRLELFATFNEAKGGTVTFKNIMMGSSGVNAKENMVWVNTDREIHCWDFSAGEPQLVSNGKNLLPKLTKSSDNATATSGLAFTFNSNGSITVNGTSAKSEDIYFAQGDVTLPAGSYVVSGAPSNSSFGNNDMFVKIMSTNVNFARSYTGTKEDAFTLTEETPIRVYCRIKANATVSNLTWQPMIRKKSDPAGYEPFDATGQIWIITGNANSLKFNALKKNGIQVYPTAVRQYAGGMWSNVSASLYKDNQWVQFSSVFAATISITYPAGSTCTCSDGKTTLRAPNTSGTWKCIVPNTGSWTVSCSDGKDTTQKVVQITADGQSKNIELSYRFIVVENGVEIIPATMYGTVAANVSKTQNNGYVTYKSTTSGNYSATVECDVTDYDYLVIKGTCDVHVTLSVIGIWNVGTSSPSNTNTVAKIDVTATGATLDISSYSGKYKVGIGWQVGKTYNITDWYLE